MLASSRLGWNRSTASKVRSVLDRAGYAELTIAELLQTPDLPSPRERRQSLPLYLCRSRGDTPLETLVRLYLLNQTVSLEAACRAVEPMSLTDWAESGLVVVEASEVRAAVELVPFQGIVLAVDWPETDVAEPVMGLASSSRLLAQLTVRRHANRVLDLGAGSGIQGLLAARHSDRVTSTERGGRAVQFARFNAELNGLANVEVVPGDWFDPVHGHEFDLITCNPPFVIAPSRRQLHTHSDRTSDQLCRDLIQAAPPFLRPNGHFQIVVNWAHVVGENWRDRLTGWFAGSGCDAWVLHADADAAPTYALQRIREQTGDPAEASRLFDEWMAYYERERIEAIGAGLITLRRAGGRPNWVRIDRFPTIGASSGAAIEQGFALRDFLEAHRDDREFLKARLRRAPHLCWEQRSEASAKGWSAISSQLRLTAGLGFVGNVDASVAAFVAGCDGERPLSAALAEIAGRDSDRMAAGFLLVARRLVELGYLLPAELK